MLGVNKYASNGLIYLAQAAISALLPLLTLLVVTRFISPKDFGDYAIAVVCAVVVTGVMSLGMLIGYERNYFKYRECRKSTGELFYTTALFLVFLFSASCLLFYLAIDWVQILLNTSSADLVMIVLVGMCFEKFVGLILIYYKASEDAKTYFLLMVISSVLNFSISIYLVVFANFGVEGVAIAYLASWLTAALLGVVLISRKLSLGLNFKYLYEVLSISLPVVPRSLTVVIGAQSDKYMLSLFGNLVALGHYSLAGRISTILNSYMVALQNVYMPPLYKALFSNSDEQIRNFESKLPFITFISIFPAVLLASFSYELIHVLFTDEYLDMSPLLAVMSVYYGILFFGKVAGGILIYSKKTGVASLLAIGAAVVNVLLNIPFIIYLDAFGAALATLLTGAAVTFCGFFIAQKFISLTWDVKLNFRLLSLLFAGGFLSLMSFAEEGFYHIVLVLKVFVVLLFFYVGSGIPVLRAYLKKAIG